MLMTGWQFNFNELTNVPVNDYATHAQLCSPLPYLDNVEINGRIRAKDDLWYCSTIYNEAYRPRLLVLPGIRDLDPAWSSCTLDWNCLFDPPTALPIAEMLLPTTSAKPGSSPPSSHATPTSPPPSPVPESHVHTPSPTGAKSSVAASSTPTDPDGDDEANLPSPPPVASKDEEDSPATTTTKPDGAAVGGGIASLLRPSTGSSPIEAPDSDPSQPSDGNEKSGGDASGESNNNGSGDEAGSNNGQG